MTELSKGANIELADARIRIAVDFPAAMNGVDLFSVLLNAAGTTDSDRNVVYFNQPTSACGGVTLDGPAIQLRLDSIPASVQTIIVAAALDADAPGTFASHDAGTVTITASGGVVASHTVTGMTEERCIVLLEIYRRNSAWKIRAVSQGWTNGVADLIESYGIAVDEQQSEDSLRPATINVPPEMAGEPMGSGEAAFRKQRASLPMNAYDQLHASEYEQGLVRGTHFVKWSDEIARLKREGHLKEALVVLLEILDATERTQAQERTNAEARAALLHWRIEDVVVRETPPGWTENAAIVLRKLGDYAGEVAVIDRWLAHAGDPAHWVGATHAKLLARREKALALRDRRQGQ